VTELLRLRGAIVTRYAVNVAFGRIGSTRLIECNPQEVLDCSAIRTCDPPAYRDLEVWASPQEIVEAWGTEGVPSVDIVHTLPDSWSASTMLGMLGEVQSVGEWWVNGRVVEQPGVNSWTLHLSFEVPISGEDGDRLVSEMSPSEGLGRQESPEVEGDSQSETSSTVGPMFWVF
jgi:hypothetical protein